MNSVFPTNNRFLAKALAFAGLQFSAYREYDEAYLKSYGCANVPEAEKRGLPGRELWLFEPSEQLSKLVAAFNAENEAIDALSKAGEPIPFCEQSSPEDRCREFVRSVRGSRLIDKTLMATMPFLRFWEDGKGEPRRIKTDRGHTVTWPGFKLLPIKASDEIRKHLGL